MAEREASSRSERIRDSIIHGVKHTSLTDIKLGLRSAYYNPSIGEVEMEGRRTEFKGSLKLHTKNLY